MFGPARPTRSANGLPAGADEVLLAYRLLKCVALSTGAPSPAASADHLAQIEPNPRGITRAEVEAAIADWCDTHMQAPLCQKLLRR
jgi:hypothetical protein